MRELFFDGVFRNNDVGSVTNWGMVERPLNRQKFSILTGILNKYDPHTTILTHNKDKEKRVTL